MAGDKRKRLPNKTLRRFERELRVPDPRKLVEEAAQQWIQLVISNIQYRQNQSKQKEGDNKI